MQSSDRVAELSNELKKWHDQYEIFAPEKRKAIIIISFFSK